MRLSMQPPIQQLMQQLGQQLVQRLIEQRTVIIAVFACACTMLAVLLAIFTVEPVANGAGLPHPSINGMLVGGDGAARLEAIAPLPVVFHFLIVLLIALLGLLGIDQKRRDRRLLAITVAACLWHALICWQLWSSYYHFLETGETDYFLGFSVATAWQVYGVWFGSLPLAVLYCWGFSRYIYTEEDETAFAELMEAEQAGMQTRNEQTDTEQAITG